MEQLIRRCQQGDRESMGQLYTTMHDELLAHCRKYAANDSIAEDLLHDAFLLIFSNIDKLRSPEKGLRWMRKVVRNVCLLYVQQQQNRAWIPVDEMQEAAQATEPDVAVTYDDILTAIDQLPRGYRQVFRLSVLEGMTHQQIAELLGIEPHTSSSQLLRAKRQLRQLLQVLMLALLAAVPLGGYYFWTLQNHKHNVAKDAEATPTDIAAVTDTTVCIPQTAIVKAEESKRVAKGAVVPENDTLQMANKPVHHDETAQPSREELATSGTQAPQTPITHHPSPITQHPSPITQHPSPITHHPEASLSLAYSGLPNSSARQLPFGAEGMNGAVDSVAHHHAPITIALNVRYPLGSRWWLDGGLRYTQLSSETRVGNTYLYMDQQQQVRYLGFSLGVGHGLWNSRHWSLYTTVSFTYELPLHSTAEASYWQNGRLIEMESNRLAPHTQWSVGVGIGLQYNLTPAIGFFVEPGLQYYFHNSNGIGTWRTEHPFTPTLPLGMSISF